MFVLELHAEPFISKSVKCRTDRFQDVAKVDRMFEKTGTVNVKHNAPWFFERNLHQNLEAEAIYVPLALVLTLLCLFAV
jgi:hypothetical protein